MSNYPGTQVPAYMVNELFGLYSRVEAAMKRTGLVKVDRFGNANPAWGDFSNMANASLIVDPDSECAAAITRLRSRPPRKQLANPLRWEMVALNRTSAIGSAIESAQRVRNNLFHGGKYEPESEPGRDTQLTADAVIVLQACVAQDIGGIRRAVEEIS